MNTCHEFQIAIEKQIAKAINQEETAQLAAHLRTCVTCVDYREASKKLDARLHALRSSDTVPVLGQNPKSARYLIEVHLRAQKARYGFSVLVFYAVLLWGWNASGGGLQWDAIGFAIGIPLIFASSYVLRSRRFAHALESEEGDFVSLYKELLAREKKNHTNTLASQVIVIVMIATGTLFETEVWLGRMLALSLACTGLYTALVRLPRLRRELAVLS